VVGYLCDGSEVNVIGIRIVHHKNTRIFVTKISPLLVLREELDFCPPNQANPTRNFFFYISLTVHNDINQFVITNLMHICFISQFR
jgi:hypothetical protein